MATAPGERLNQIPGAMPRLDRVPTGCPFHPRCPLAEAGCYVDPPPTIEDCDGRAACWVRARERRYAAMGWA
jgi:peptide/nickel transport system ATP-binding protein